MTQKEGFSLCHAAAWPFEFSVSNFGCFVAYFEYFDAKFGCFMDNLGYFMAFHSQNGANYVL